MECKEHNVITGSTRICTISFTAAAPSTPNRRFLFTVYVAFQPLRSPQNKSTVSRLQASLKTLSYHCEISKTFYFRSQNISLHQEPNMYNTLILIIILNAQLITT